MNQYFHPFFLIAFSFYAIGCLERATPSIASQDVARQPITDHLETEPKEEQSTLTQPSSGVEEGILPKQNLSSKPPFVLRALKTTGLGVLKCIAGLVAGFTTAGTSFQFGGYVVRKYYFKQDVTPLTTTNQNTTQVNHAAGVLQAYTDVVTRYRVLGILFPLDRTPKDIVRSFRMQAVSQIKRVDPVSGFPVELVLTLAGALGGCIGANLVF